MRDQPRFVTLRMVTRPVRWRASAACCEPKDRLVYACVDKHDGDVRIVDAREHCRRRERRLTWPRDVAPPAPDPGPAPAPTSAVAEVLDAAGVVVGPMVGMNGNFPIVGIRRNGFVFPFIAANLDGFPALAGLDKVYYESPTCDGVPHMAPSVTPFPMTGVDVSGNGYGYPGGAPGSVRGTFYFTPWEGCTLETAPPAVLPALQLFTANSFVRPSAFAELRPEEAPRGAPSALTPLRAARRPGRPAASGRSGSTFAAAARRRGPPLAARPASSARSGTRPDSVPLAR